MGRVESAGRKLGKRKDIRSKNNGAVRGNMARAQEDRRGKDEGLRRDGNACGTTRKKEKVDRGGGGG